MPGGIKDTQRGQRVSLFFISLAAVHTATDTVTMNAYLLVLSAALAVALAGNPFPSFPGGLFGKGYTAGKSGGLLDGPFGIGLGKGKVAVPVVGVGKAVPAFAAKALRPVRPVPANPAAYTGKAVDVYPGHGYPTKAVGAYPAGYGFGFGGYGKPVVKAAAKAVPAFPAFPVKAVGYGAYPAGYGYGAYPAGYGY